MASTNFDPIMQGLAGHTSTAAQMNTSRTSANRSLANQSLDVTGRVPRNMEQTLSNLEDSFWYILNNPSCYNEIIYRFFDKHCLFSMFPHCETFFRLFRLTGKTTFN